MSEAAELDRRLNAYLAIREVVGLANNAQVRLLRNFIAYAQHAGPGTNSPIRATTALSWAWDDAPASCGVRGRSDRLAVARGFLTYLSCFVPGTEVPGPRLVAGSTRRRPYIFSNDEIRTLIVAAAITKSRTSLRPVMLSTLLGLLASTGLRIGEAVRLKMDDVRLDDTQANLQILQTKFQKSRIVPIHPTVVVALESYRNRRQREVRSGWSDSFFVNQHGGLLAVHDLWRWFTQLTRSLGMVPSSEAGLRPCLTSFRHTFAVRRLREWHEAGLDVQSLLPTLAVYLGHVGPESTYWYLSATPDLLRAAGARFTLDVPAGVEP
jgi:integrase/recombinase XerD